MAGRNPSARSRDMVISMAVILIPVLLIVAWFSIPGEHDPDSPVATATPSVNVAGTLERARTESPYALLTPQGLEDGWRPMRVGWAADGEPWITGEAAEGNSWQIGYLSPEGIYFGVQQRDEDRSRFVTTVTRQGRSLGAQVDLAGRTWDRYESKDGRTRSLVATGEGDETAIVSADTDFTELEAFASTLTEVGPGKG